MWIYGSKGFSELKFLTPCVSILIMLEPGQPNKGWWLICPILGVSYTTVMPFDIEYQITDHIEVVNYRCRTHLTHWSTVFCTSPPSRLFRLKTFEHLGCVSPTSIKSQFNWTRFNVDRRFEPSSSTNEKRGSADMARWRGSAEPWLWTLVVRPGRWLVRFDRD